ncbi:MAG: CPBP family intramembrane metalloprotease [Polyangiaceae bacterium]|nr:CPBP family intramembrane metalloprotease [Polyangiaceae bacterium]
MRPIALVVSIVAAANALAFRLDFAGTWKFWVLLGAPYAVLAGFALWFLWDSGTLLDVMKPRWGDFSLGFLTAAVLLGATWTARSLIVPAGSERHLWFLRLYAQVGDADTVQRSLLLTTVLLGIALSEELIWRGYVLPTAESRFGTRSGWVVAALAYTAAHLPSVATLGDPIAGPNPLLVMAALGAGLVWTFTAKMTRRLPPVIVSHLAFSYFSVVQFRWPGM